MIQWLRAPVFLDDGVPEGDKMSENGTNQEPRLKLGERLRILRAVLYKSQVAMARELECDQSLVTRWESGERDIPAGRLEQIKRLYGVDLEDKGWEEPFIAIPGAKVESTT